MLLFSGMTEESICSRLPVYVDVTSVFVVDLNKLSSPKDVACDDIGAWTWGGSNRRLVSVDEDGFVEFVSKKEEKTMSNGCYKVWKRYYSLEVSPDVKKLIIVLEGTVRVCVCVHYTTRQVFCLDCTEVILLLYIMCACVCCIRDNDGDTLNLALVQYFFSEGEHKLLTAPHGNSRYRQPYIWTNAQRHVQDQGRGEEINT